MDGNRRWAKKNSKSIPLSHKLGAENAKKIAKAAQELGVKYLTLYAFSTENWNRSPSEVKYLMSLLTNYLKSDKNELIESNMRLNIIGDSNKLSKKLIDNILKLAEKTKNNTGLVLTIALNYGSRNEIIAATKKITQDILDKKLNLKDINDKIFSSYLYTNDLPDPDLFIRPGGEYRISNFLLWQIAYSELYFTEKYWPEFTKEDLKQAIEEFSNRERRYGK
jgi:undecaprenyl diphosphate synthase